MRKNNAKVLLVCLTAVLFICWMGPSSAFGWEPSKPVEIVSHSSAGTGGDIFIRTLSDIWAKNKFIPVRTSVQNITGARGDKARRYIAVKNKGNPHYLFSYVPSQLNTPILDKSDISHRSFVPLSLMAVQTPILVVHNESPYKSLSDLIEAARKKPKQITQGGGSYGNIASLVGKMLMDHAGVTISYVPYKGGGEATVALLGKHIDFIIENVQEVREHVKAGNFRIIAATDKLQSFPAVRTFKEQGYDFKTITQFLGLVAPQGIPAEAAAYYIKLLERTRGTTEWKSYLERNDLAEFSVAGDAMAKFLDDEELFYLRLNKEIGLLK